MSIPIPWGQRGSGHHATRVYVFFIALLLLPISARGAGTDRTLEGEERPYGFYGDIRYRYESRDNFSDKYYGSRPAEGAAHDAFLLQRLQIGMRYKVSRHLELALGMRDARVWDLDVPDEAYYNKSFGMINHPHKGYTEPYETYLKFNGLWGRDVTCVAGRQTICYGDNRIFGPGDWGNTGRYQWDALRLSWKNGPHFLDALWGAYIIREPEELSLNHRHDGYGAAIYGHYEAAGALILEPFLASKYDRHETFKGESGTGDRESWFSGVRLYGSLANGTYYDVTGVLERGTYGADQIRAYGYHIKGGWKVKSLPWSPDVSAEYSYASGDDDPTDGTRKTFAGVFGARDTMYGRVNLFDWENLGDAQANLMVFPRKGLSFLAEFHKFWLAEEKDSWSLNRKLYRDRTGRSGDEVGRELDLIATYDFKPGMTTMDDKIKIMVGACRFWPDTFAKQVADDEAADWIFVQMNYCL